MLSSIHPLGERARNNRWGLTAASYVLGSAAGGSALGAAAGLIGWGAWSLARPGHTVVGAIVLAACALCLALDAVGASLPTRHHQVDEDWLNRYRGWVYGAGFGFQLGLGVVTIVRTATVYATVALAFVTGSAAEGALIGAVFGLARALPVLAVRRVEQPHQLRQVHLSLHRLGPQIGRLSALTLVLLVAAGAAVMV